METQVCELGGTLMSPHRSMLLNRLPLSLTGQLHQLPVSFDFPADVRLGLIDRVNAISVLESGFLSSHRGR